jgi:hypothetical protein
MDPKLLSMRIIKPWRMFSTSLKVLYADAIVKKAIEVQLYQMLFLDERRRTHQSQVQVLFLNGLNPVYMVRYFLVDRSYFFSRIHLRHDIQPLLRARGVHRLKPLEQFIKEWVFHLNVEVVKRHIHRIGKAPLVALGVELNGHINRKVSNVQVLYLYRKEMENVNAGGNIRRNVDAAQLEIELILVLSDDVAVFIKDWLESENLFFEASKLVKFDLIKIYLVEEDV